MPIDSIGHSHNSVHYLYLYLTFLTFKYCWVLCLLFFCILKYTPIWRIVRILVPLENQKFEAVLTAANDSDISLEWKAREPKPIGKGKVTVQKKATLLYGEINEAKVKILF